MRSLLKILPAAAVLACATAAPAQEITFRQIPWTSPLDSVRASLGRAGYTYLGLRYDGHTFALSDSTYVTVVMRSTGHPLNFVVHDFVQGEGIVARFRVIADSLERTLGRPAESRPSMVRWEAGATSAQVAVRALGTGKLGVETVYRGPEWSETVGNGDGPDWRELPAAYTIISRPGGMRVSVDTASISTQRDGSLRGRFRVDLPRMQVVGISDVYNGIEYEMDFDCAGGRTHLRNQTLLDRGRRGRSGNEQVPWRAPSPATDEARVLEVVCHARGREPAVAALPVRSGLGEVPAGWILVAQREGGRSLLDSASVAAKGEGGVYTVTVRAEFSPYRATPLGLSNGMTMRLEVDCPGRRTRAVGGTVQADGRDLRAVPVPPSESRWSSERTPVIDVACRVAGAPSP
jgi:hypothetical protein